MTNREELARIICQVIFNEDPDAQSFGASDGTTNWMERVYLADAIVEAQMRAKDNCLKWTAAK